MLLFLNIWNNVKGSSYSLALFPHQKLLCCCALYAFPNPLHLCTYYFEARRTFVQHIVSRSIGPRSAPSSSIPYYKNLAWLQIILWDWNFGISSLVQIWKRLLKHQPWLKKQTNKWNPWIYIYQSVNWSRMPHGSACFVSSYTSAQTDNNVCIIAAGENDANKEQHLHTLSIKISST